MARGKKQEKGKTKKKILKGFFAKKETGTAISIYMMVAWQWMAGSAAAKHNTAATYSRFSHLQLSCHCVK